jgi:DNA polymerase-3 subunit epsilon
MNVLILDTETTGVDPAKDKVVEVAAILYSIEHATVLSAFSSLLSGEANAAEKINRIPAEALKVADTFSNPWTAVTEMAVYARAVVAHNAPFDYSFVPEHLRRVAPWICSMDDIEWPCRNDVGSRSLVAIALEHDLGIAYAHRAMADCDLIARLFTRAHELGEDLAELVKRAMRPKGEFIAVVSYQERELAKKAGFRWEPESKTWRRRMFLEDLSKLPFRTKPGEASAP